MEITQKNLFLLAVRFGRRYQYSFRTYTRVEALAAKSRLIALGAKKDTINIVRYDSIYHR